MFVGSDDHAESAGHLFSLIASARLDALDPEAYLRDLLRVLPHWPRDRFLELAPKLWPRTRDRLAPTELAADLGPLTLPPTIKCVAQDRPLRAAAEREIVVRTEWPSSDRLRQVSARPASISIDGRR